MRHREFVSLVGGAAVVWPVRGWTQQEEDAGGRFHERAVA